MVKEVLHLNPKLKIVPVPKYHTMKEYRGMEVTIIVLGLVLPGGECERFNITHLIGHCIESRPALDVILKKEKFQYPRHETAVDHSTDSAILVHLK